MKVDLNIEIKNLDGSAIIGGPLIAAEQLAGLVIADRGASVDTALGAFNLNTLMGHIAVSKEPVDLSTDDITLLHKVLDAAVASKNASTFLVGRLYGILESSANDN